MIFDVVKGGDDEDEGLGVKVDLKTLFIMAVATSIDALAVGVTFGMEPDVQIIPSALLIGATTFVISFSGVIIGNVFGARWKDKAQIVGGVMLILVGLKILLEGLGVFHLGF
ncbi:MAG: manganese efflux pump, partial [Eubacteriales bacterium]|nr:manganese efflux pump [Eubacteriales bacterium]